MEWNNDICMKLIEGYRKLEVLWNPRDENYYNKIKKEDAWQELGIVLEKSKEEIKKKIESLKGSYRREKNRVKTSYGTGKGQKDIYKSKWFAFDALTFLDDKDEPRKSISNVPSTSEEKDYSSDDGEMTTVEEGTACLPQFNTPVEELTSTPSTKKLETPCTSKRAKRTSTKTTEDPRIQEAFSYLREAKNKKKDRCDIFGEFVANKLKTFDDRSKAIAEHRIHTVLFEMELTKYGQPSSSLSSSQSDVQNLTPSQNIARTQQFNQPHFPVNFPSQNSTQLTNYFSSFSDDTDCNSAGIEY